MKVENSTQPIHVNVNRMHTIISHANNIH